MARSRKNTARPWPFHFLPNPLIPEKVRIFLAKRLVDSFALFLMGFGLWGLLSLITYNPMDPAFNVASSSDISNWGGAFGSGFSDLMIQTIGYGTLGFLIVSTIAGIRLIKREIFVIPFPIRLIVLIAGVFVLASGFAIIPAPETWGIQVYKGGLIGAKLFNVIFNVTGLPILLSILFFIIGTILCAISIGYPLSSWQKGWAAIKKSILWIITSIRRTFGWV
jgi:hypothetical protein